MTLGGLVILLGMIVMGQGWQAIHAARGGLVTVLGLGGFMLVMFRRERSPRSSIGG